MRFNLVSIAFFITFIAKSQVAVTTGLSETISGMPGDVSYINVGLINTGSEPRKVIFSLTDYYTTCDSGYVYKPAGTLDNSISNWITMDLNEIVLESKEKATVVLKIDIPQNYSKPHATANLMVSNEAVETALNTNEFTLGIALQYAVNLIYTRSDLEGDYSNLNVENVEVDTVESTLKIKYLNTGVKTTSFEIQAEIVSNEGDVMLSELTKTRQIQPNQCRDFNIPITQPMESGIYQIILVATNSLGESYGMTHEISL